MNKTHGSLFSGFDAPSVAASWMGWKNAFHCEINSFCNEILKYWFPDSEHYEDITKTDFSQWKGRIDVLTGGFPCQPFSLAGQRKGADDNRYLWPEMLRAIREIRPTWVIGENVAGILTMVQPGKETEVGSQTSLFGEDNRKRVLLRQEYVVETICKDLEREGYSVQPLLIPACAVGAPHRRDRVWFIANRSDAGIEDLQQEREDGVFPSRITPDTDGAGLPETRPEQRAAGIAGDGLQRDVTNSQRVRSNEVLENLQPEQPDGKGITLVSSERFAADAESTGIKGERDKGQGKIQFNRRDLQSVRPSWQNFPTTEPAIRRGDDGISGRLSGITFSRWRQESIKALGNSMVPQVVLEIFKAIESVESSVR